MAKKHKRKERYQDKILVDYSQLSDESKDSLSIPEYYIDRGMKCSKCSKKFTFTAQMQKEWYEVKKRYIEVVPKYCDKHFEEWLKDRKTKLALDNFHEKLKELSESNESTKANKDEIKQTLHDILKIKDLEISEKTFNKICRVLKISQLDDAPELREEFRTRLAKTGKEAIRQMIIDAFKDVKLDNGIGLYEADAIDDYASEEERKEAKAKDERYNWQHISSEDLAINPLPFVDPKGMRFLLPAYMIESLKDNSSTDPIFSLVYHDTTNFKLLNREQRQSVRAYLKLMKQHEDFEFEKPEIERALNKYWN